MPVYQFPTTTDRAWRKIEAVIRKRLRVRGMSPESIAKIVGWARAKHHDHWQLYPPPSIDFPATEDAVIQFSDALLHQRMMIFFDMVDLYAENHAPGRNR